MQESMKIVTELLSLMIPVLHSKSSSSGVIAGACFIEAPTPCSRSFLNTRTRSHRSTLSWPKRWSFLFIKLGALGVLDRTCLHSPARSWLIVLGGYCWPSSGDGGPQLTNAESHLSNTATSGFSSTSEGHFSAPSLLRSSIQLLNTFIAQ